MQLEILSWKSYFFILLNRPSIDFLIFILILIGQLVNRQIGQLFIIFSTYNLLYAILLNKTKNKFAMSLQVTIFIFSNLNKYIEQVSRLLR